MYHWAMWRQSGDEYTKMGEVNESQEMAVHQNQFAAPPSGWNSCCSSKGNWSAYAGFWFIW